MIKVEIYTTLTCPYCKKAKSLLNSKGIPYTEIDITNNPQTRVYMKQRTNGHQSVPQIFINEQHIGGCDDLYNLEAVGKLDSLLKGSNID